MKTIPLTKKYEIRIDGNYPSLRKADGTIWEKSDDETVDSVVLQEIIKMRELLQAIVDTRYISMDTPQDAFSALTKAANYINNLPK